MRRLLRALVAVALAACARAAPLDSDAQGAPAATPERWIEPISWQPRCVLTRSHPPGCHAARVAPSRNVRRLAPSDRPRATRSAFLYHGFLSPEECEHIKSVARPRMERSMVRRGCPRPRVPPLQRAALTAPPCAA